MTVTAPIETQPALSLTRQFDAPIDQVFDAWTNPEVIARWFGPEGFKVVNKHIELHVGGKYQIDILSPNDEVIKHFGEYVEITPPIKLVFTWKLENQACEGSKGQSANTLVSISFFSHGEETELHLVHEQLPDKAAYDGHSFGWNSSFDSLSQLLSNTI